MAGIADWTEWKEKCALALCSGETQAELRSFAGSRFYKYAAAYAGGTNVRDPAALAPEPAEAWHWFETWFRLRNTREGKSYKEWLFARHRPGQDAGLDSIQGGATLLMRDVVRECLRRERPARGSVSLDDPTEGMNGTVGPGLHELMPDSADTVGDVERREFESVAAAEAADALSAMNHRERVALLGRELGLSLAHPAVIGSAGCGKSVLFTAYQTALQGIACGVRDRHPREDGSALASLSIAVFDRVKGLVVEWGKSEKSCRRLFHVVEG